MLITFFLYILIKNSSLRTSFFCLLELFKEKLKINKNESTKSKFSVIYVKLKETKECKGEKVQMNVSLCLNWSLNVQLAVKINRASQVPS